MRTKYGQAVRPYECTINLPNIVSGDLGNFLKSMNSIICCQFKKRNIINI